MRSPPSASTVVLLAALAGALCALALPGPWGCTVRVVR